MENGAQPFWEKTYRSESQTFSVEPNATLKEFERLLSKQAGALDVGCGEGQNCLYLARQGWTDVDAFDISVYGIERVRRRCEAERLKINAFTADLREFQFKRSYDLVMSFGTLHFVSREEWKEFIFRAKENTRHGGIHIMQIFTDTLPASPDISEFAIGLAKDGELKELYEDWEILQFKSYTFEDEHPGVPKHYHASNKLVARRK
ncbi:MAG: class I SAM-dependent methyltransferase [Acutalibacter sp.]|jgi:tellurite methyltransferase|uniref:class I SAM-dependent methyltransferase n=1 Tax=Acutalibacter sp. TaxID=1918636 RepID=UPI0021719337|nr:class I SAM-dependent methyltransferase [Acutalibacter sp.]MCI9225231.1 class I SAM-dependent methyltransferase [Acutalibacter sp.]